MGRVVQPGNCGKGNFWLNFMFDTSAFVAARGTARVPTKVTGSVAKNFWKSSSCRDICAKVAAGIWTVFSDRKEILSLYTILAESSFWSCMGRMIELSNSARCRFLVIIFGVIFSIPDFWQVKSLTNRVYCRYLKYNVEGFSCGLYRRSRPRQTQIEKSWGS